MLITTKKIVNMHLKVLTKLEEQEIAEVLSQFGLNEKERAVYLFLLKSQRETITPIARALSYPVTTVQSILTRLDETGLLDVTTNKSRHIYEAKEPNILRRILERRIEDVKTVIPLLNKLKDDEVVKSKIRIYYRERAADIFHEALQAKDKIIYEIISAKDFQDIMGEKFHFSKRRKEKGVRLKSLRVEEYEIKKYNKTIHERELREAKFLPREMTFRSSIMFWDNKVAFFTTKSEGLAYVVESAVIREMVGQMFDMLWSVSRRMETLIETQLA